MGFSIRHPKRGETTLRKMKILTFSDSDKMRIFALFYCIGAIQASVFSASKDFRDGDDIIYEDFELDNPDIFTGRAAAIGNQALPAGNQNKVQLPPQPPFFV